jgi:hypothetical protein
MLAYGDAWQVSELLSGIRVLKYFSWERPAMEKVMQVRHKEMTTLWRFGILGALQGVLWHSTTAFVAIAIFGTYTYLGNRYGTQFTCFTGANVQILTLRTLVRWAPTHTC